MDSSRRTAGFGLLAFGIGTPLAFIGIGAPGGDYSDHAVASFVASGHWPVAFALAYLGAFASLGLLPFARRMRHELGTAGEVFWGLSVAGTAAGVIGWFMLGGVAVAVAEGGDTVAALPHPVFYLAGEIGVLIAICASAFLVGVAALMLGVKAALPTPLRVLSWVGGVSGILAAFYFPLPLFFLWAIVVGGWAIASPSRATAPVAREVQPV
ncbi:MAG: hypothetical protein QOH17_763 [Pseudonocardiales bacterium]|jgi:hypothetical protein|nr:hypothetical protein [Pseudonocardiales bacterium]